MGPSMYRFDPELSAHVLASIGLDLASWDDMAPVYSLAQTMIGGDVASADVMRRVQAHTGGSVYVCREGTAITGLLAWLPLTPKGLRALISGRFNGLNPALAHLCGPGQASSAAYGWGYAGTTRKASALVIKGTLLARREVCPQLPFFTRGSTPDGARILRGRLDCQPFPIDRPGLFWSPPLVKAAETAAA